MGEGGGCSGGIKDTGHHGGDRRRHYETDGRIKRGKRRDTHHAVTASGRGKAPEAGPRQHGTAGAEAQAPCTGGRGNKGKAGNLKDGSTAGKRSTGKGGDHPGAVQIGRAHV